MYCRNGLKNYLAMARCDETIELDALHLPSSSLEEESRIQNSIGDNGTESHLLFSNKLCSRSKNAGLENYPCYQPFHLLFQRVFLGYAYFKRGYCKWLSISWILEDYLYAVCYPNCAVSNWL